MLYSPAPWQGDLYHHPEQPQMWYLLLCTAQGQTCWEAVVPQAEVNAAWLQAQLAELADSLPTPSDRATAEDFLQVKLENITTSLPAVIQVFRPQTLGLWQKATENLPITIQPTRRTAAIKLLLSPEMIRVESLPPQALPDELWGKHWRLGTIVAQELATVWRDRPIPICDIPEAFEPWRIGLASQHPIPGVVINGDRRAMQLARWLQAVQPEVINYIPTEAGQSGGLVLEAGLCDRWIIATFEDAEMAQAAERFQQQRQAAGGLHFLLVQPDDSGMTYSGFWLLRAIA